MKADSAKQHSVISVFHPVGRLVQAAVCRTVPRCGSAIPARDSNLLQPQRTQRTQKILCDLCDLCGSFFPATRTPVPARTSFRRAGRRPAVAGSAFVSRSLRTATRVANLDSEVPALNRREPGANPGQPTNSNCECRVRSAESAAARNPCLHSALRAPNSTFKTHPW